MTPSTHVLARAPTVAAGSARAHLGRPTRSSAYGTSTSFPFAAEPSSISCARGASDRGRRSATTEWSFALTQQLEQGAEVLAEHLRVAGAPYGKRSASPSGLQLVALAQL